MNKIVFTISVLILASLTLFAQDKGSVFNDYMFENRVVGNEGNFILYESDAEFSRCVLNEKTSSVWAISNQSSTLRGYDLRNAGGNGKVEKTISLSFRPYSENDGIVSSPDGNYLALLEAATPVVLHIISTSTNSEVFSTRLHKNINEASKCRFGFVSNEEVVVAAPHIMQTVNATTRKSSTRKIDLNWVRSVISTGLVSGVRAEKQKGSKSTIDKAVWYDINTKKYHYGTLTESANFIRVTDNEKVKRFYIRKNTNKEMTLRWDNTRQYGITDNSVIPSQPGQPAIRFEGCTCLGWTSGESQLVLAKKQSSGRQTLMVVDYSRLDMEFQKQSIMSAARNYQQQKLRDYLTQYPNSTYKQFALNEALSMYKNAPMDQFNYQDVKGFYAKYSHMQDQVEPLLAAYVRNPNDASKFLSDFPNSELKKNAFVNAFIQKELDKAEVDELCRAYGNSSKLTSKDPIVSASESTKTNFMRSMYNQARPKDEYDMYAFFAKYTWLSYPEKAEDAMNHLWDFASKSQNSSDGDYLVWMIKSLPDMQENKKLKLGITTSRANKFVDDKLRAEMSKVTIQSPKIASSTSDEWDNWLKSEYTAGLVKQEGRRQFILYGTVTNNSNFSLPLEVQGKASLMYKAEAKGSGFVSNLLAALANSQQKEKQIGARTEYFYIPYMKPHSTSMYAILLDFGSGEINTGINVLDWMKIYSSTYIKNQSVSVDYSTKTVTDDVLQKQDDWQQFAKGGLPQATLTDLWRNERGQANVWANRKYERDRKRREFWQSALSSSGSSGSSSYGSSGSSSKSSESVSSSSCYEVLDNEEKIVYYYPSDGSHYYDGNPSKTKCKYYEIKCSNGDKHEFVYIPFEMHFQGYYNEIKGNSWYYVKYHVLPSSYGVEPDYKALKPEIEDLDAEIKKICKCN